MNVSADRANAARRLRHRGPLYSLLLLASVGLLASCSTQPADPTAAGTKSEKAQTATDPYPLSPEMVLLERDAGSEEYRAIVRDMISTELAAEWQRAINPDDAASFLSAHGGAEAVAKDPELARAHGRRQQIASQFLEVMRQEYKRREQKAPFDSGAAAMAVPKAVGKTGSNEAVAIEIVHPNEAAASQWYRWRGPSGQGLVAEPQPPLRWGPTENILWRREIPGKGNSSPILWGDQIFLTTATADGKTRSLLSIDRANGAIKWQRNYAAETIEKSVIEKNGYASATPATDGECIVAFLGNAGMVACDLEGKELWKTDLGAFNGMHGPGTSPVIHGGLVILVQDQNDRSLSIGLDLKTGETRWRRERPGAMGWCTPVALAIGGQEELVYASDQRLLAIDPANGAELWSRSGPTREPVPSIVTDGGLIFCTSGRNGPTLACRPPGRTSPSGGERTSDEAQLLWTAARGGPHVPSPVLVDGLLYLISDRGILTCLDAMTGETVFQQRLEGKYSASPIAAGGYLFVSSEEGDTHVLRVGRRFEEIAVNSLGEPLLASFALVDRVLYARTPSSLIAIAER